MGSIILGIRGVGGVVHRERLFKCREGLMMGLWEGILAVEGGYPGGKATFFTFIFFAFADTHTHFYILGLWPHRYILGFLTFSRYLQQSFHFCHAYQIGNEFSATTLMPLADKILIQQIVPFFFKKKKKEVTYITLRHRSCRVDDASLTQQRTFSLPPEQLLM